MRVIALSDVASWVGREIGVSEWMTVDQGRIDRFADVTEDWQFIHVEPEKAKATPFGGTIAHGFLTLSLLSMFAERTALRIEGAEIGINYGFNRIRNPAPVRAGARIRGRFFLKRFEMKSPTRALFTYEVTVEIEGENKPAIVAEWLAMQELAADADTGEALHAEA